MKKFKFAALLMCFAAMGLMFASCQKDEDLILGKWKCVKITDEDRTTTYTGDDAPIYEFKADNTLAITYQGYGSTAGTYTIKDDVLTITVMGESTAMNVDKLTKKKMILSDPENAKNTAEFDKI